jgi:hypothetical protein
MPACPAGSSTNGGVSAEYGISGGAAQPASTIAASSTPLRLQML